MMTVRGANVLDRIGIDPAEYRVEYFDGPPLMLAFEAQRIMRERAGGYDFYGYMEDDLSVTDPAFFDKIGWFAAEFGVDKMLVPARYEMSHTGTLAKMTIEPRLSGDTVKALRRAGLPAALSGRWHGREQTFQLPNNPHSGCYFLTDAQLKHWMAQPSFDDRDASWVDPLVSAATYAPGRVFGMYRAGEPDPWFLEIEHFGTFYASMAAKPGETVRRAAAAGAGRAGAGGRRSPARHHQQGDGRGARHAARTGVAEALAQAARQGVPGVVLAEADRPGVAPLLRRGGNRTPSATEGAS